MTLDEVLDSGACPAMAILRGIEPDQCLDVGRVLVEAGIRIIEVPLNSPEPLVSIARMVDAFARDAAIGAGTVLTEANLQSVIETGASFAVAPNFVPQVVHAAVRAEFEFLPGVFTPSEVFGAIAAGSKRLKLFPASSAGPAHAKAICAVTDPGIGLWAVGGVDASNAASWIAAGCEGVAAGSNLFAAGKPVADIGADAREFCKGLAGQ